MSDPFAQSTDPDIPTPTREDLILLVHRRHHEGISRGSANADLIKTLLEGARRVWDERHKRDAERRRKEEYDKETIREFYGDAWKNASIEDLAHETIPDTSPPAKGTRVPGQRSDSASEHERREREQKQIEIEIVATMHPTHREKYSDPGTPENQRQAIFETYKTKWGERKRREDAEFQKKLDRIAEAQDWLQRIEGDPSKAHLPRPADDSEEELFKWHHEMSKPVDHVPFGNPSEQWVRRDRMWRDIQATGRADPKDIAEEEAEALRYRLQVQEARERKLRELETEFVPRRPVPEKRKEDPPVVREADPKPTWLDKFWKLAESNFFMGGGVAMAIAGYGFILAGAPRFGFWLLVIAWIVMSMSIWRHRFFEGRSKASEFMNNLITCGLVGILLFVIWILVV